MYLFELVYGPREVESVQLEALRDLSFEVVSVRVWCALRCVWSVHIYPSEPRPMSTPLMSETGLKNCVHYWTEQTSHVWQPNFKLYPAFSLLFPVVTFVQSFPENLSDLWPFRPLSVFPYELSVRVSSHTSTCAGLHLQGLLKLSLWH